MLAALVALSSPPSAVAGHSDSSRAVQSVIRAGGVQTELPVNAESDWPTLSILAWLVDVILWRSVITRAITIAIAMRDSLPGLDRSNRFASPAQDAGGRSKLNPMSAAQVEADVLVSRGLYAEAIHVLLLRALAEMRDRLQTSFADSLDWPDHAFQSTAIGLPGDPVAPTIGSGAKM